MKFLILKLILFDIICSINCVNFGSGCEDHFKFTSFDKGIIEIKNPPRVPVIFLNVVLQFGTRLPPVSINFK
jgi:hypothetical protein